MILTLNLSEPKIAYCCPCWIKMHYTVSVECASKNSPSCPFWRLLWSNIHLIFFLKLEEHDANMVSSSIVASRSKNLNIWWSQSHFLQCCYELKGTVYTRVLLAMPSGVLPDKQGHTRIFFTYFWESSFHLHLNSVQLDLFSWICSAK